MIFETFFGLCYTQTAMKKVLLLNPPGRLRYLRDQYCSSSAKSSYYWPAVDLLALSGKLKHDFELKVIDAIAENKSVSVCLREISRFSPDAVISLTSTASKDEDFSFFHLLKSRTAITLLINGGYALFAPEKYLREDSPADAVITDFTSASVQEFLRGSRTGLKGIRCREEKNPVLDEALIREFSYPSPRHDLFPLRKYFTPQARHLPFSSVLASFGCAYDCGFCIGSRMKWRLRSLDNLRQELEAIRRLGIREVHFSDFTFSAKREHCLEVCGLMKKLGLSWDCLTRIDCIDRDLVRVMKQSGCHTIQLGVETADSELRRSLGKPLTLEAVKAAFSLCREAGIATIGFFMLGLPGEDARSILQTGRLARSLDCDYASFSVYVPDFGTPLRKQLPRQEAEDEEYGFNRCLQPRRGNGRLSGRQIWSLRNRCVRRFYLRPGYIMKILTKAGPAGLLRKFRLALSLLLS